MSEQMTRRAKLLSALQRWRDEDHEDALTLSRDQVIELIEAYRDLEKQIANTSAASVHFRDLIVFAHPDVPLHAWDGSRMVRIEPAP